jgi:hypothetical protein
MLAWGGVGKSTVVNHCLRRMAAKHYGSARLVFGWSFYKQGTNKESCSADEFLNSALAWFGDSDPAVGTATEKGERLARLIGSRRTLLVVDGLEPLQNPPGTQEARIREPALRMLLRDLAAFNKGLCVITTRLPVAYVADYEGTSAFRWEVSGLPAEAGAKLLRSLGVSGDDLGKLNGTYATPVFPVRTDRRLTIQTQNQQNRPDRATLGPEILSSGIRAGDPA